MCFRETPFTALQQGDINDLLRVSVPVQINRVIIKLAVQINRVIIKIMGCDHMNKDSQEEKLGRGKSLVTQAAIDEMLRRGAAYMQI